MRHKRVLDDADVPPTYPRELESTAVLDDGRRVWIRPMAPCDREGLEWEIEHADGETLYLRFFTRAIKAHADTVEGLLDLDYRQRLALAAIGPDGEGAGVVRYACTDRDDEAQIAVVVAPEWRHAGLGMVLLDRIQEAARNRGIRRLTAVYLAENTVVDAIREGLGLPEPIIRHGLAEVDWDLAEEPADQAGGDGAGDGRFVVEQPDVVDSPRRTTNAEPARGQDPTDSRSRSESHPTPNG